jgi:hypothetical protein
VKFSVVSLDYAEAFLASVQIFLAVVLFLVWDFWLPFVRKKKGIKKRI